MTSSTPRTGFFDRWSATYDRRALQRFTYRPIHDRVLARIRATRPSVVVDLGCGTGQLTRRLAQQFSEAVVVGVDFSPGMLDKAAAAGRGQRGAVNLIQADALNLPLRPGCVDLVVCTESFHWYPDQAGVLAGLAAAMHPGGRLVIVSIAALTTIGDDVVRRVSALGGRTIRALPPGRLQRLLVGAGFSVTEQRRTRRTGPFAPPVLTDARLVP